MAKKKKTRPPKTAKQLKAARALEDAKLAWLDAGADRILIHGRYHQANRGLAGRDVLPSERDCLNRLHQFDRDTRKRPRPIQDHWDGGYLVWAKKCADALFALRYRTYVELFLGRRFPDTYKGAKQFQRFIEALPVGGVMQHFPTPKDRSNPLDAISWELGFAAGQATEALNHRFNVPDRTGSVSPRTKDIRNRTLDAVRKWRSDPDNNDRSAPKCNEIILILPGVKSISSGGAGSDPMKSKLLWDDDQGRGKMTVGTFQVFWSKMRNHPEIKTALSRK